MSGHDETKICIEPYIIVKTKAKYELEQGKAHAQQTERKTNALEMKCNMTAKTIE